MYGAAGSYQHLRHWRCKQLHVFIYVFLRKNWSCPNSLYEKHADKFIPRAGRWGRAYNGLRLGKAVWPEWGSLSKSPI